MNIEYPKFNTQPPIGNGAGAGLTMLATDRLSVQTVERMRRLVAGDPHVEGMVLQFIADEYGAVTLPHLPPHVAEEILKRPADFIQAAKKHGGPELKFSPRSGRPQKGTE